MIYITGAGCGDFSLLTVKAKRVIEQADCILYDRLIDTQILGMAKESCEIIYVGKENHQHTLAQEHINALLVEKGRQYPCIVRLKGGDPYVFGRGSEEAIYIVEHHLDFEIIPGVTSAIAGSAFAGIPVTHRGCALGVRIMSAHTKEDTFSDMDFLSMASTKDTLVFLMGLSNLKEIVEHLLLAGKPMDTPIAIISNAAKFNQHKVYGNLSTILQQDVHELVSPSIIVVGEVVGFQEKLSFMEHKPLFHKRYLMGTLHYEEGLLWQFQEKGACIDMILCGQIVYLPHTLHHPLDAYTHILFTSRNGVDAFFHQLFETGRDVRALSHLKLCTIGEKTAEYLKKYGCHANLVSDVASSEDFAKYLKKYLTKDSLILLPKANNHHDVLEKMLLDICEVECIAVYETIAKPLQLEEKSYDGLLFTCSFSVHTMMKEIKTWKNICTKPVYAMGKRTSETLRKYGFEYVIEIKNANRYQFIESIMKEETYV